MPKVVTYGYLAGTYAFGPDKASQAVSEILKQNDLLCYSPFVVGYEHNLFIISTDESSYEFQLKRLKEAGVLPKPLNQAPVGLHKILAKKYDLSEERLIDEKDVWEACLAKMAA